MLEFEGPAPADAGLAVEISERGGLTRWSVTNVGNIARAVNRVRLRWRVDARGPVRMLRNGFQSWSACHDGFARDAIDPSLRGGAPGLIRATHHADPDIVRLGELRSELVTRLSDDDGAVVLGFDGGDRHDGTFRLLGDELVAEAFLGGAVLEPGERRELHAIRVGGDGLDAWAAWAGTVSHARVDAPYQVGWCSWYQYFHDITERIFRDNLALAADWPFDVFQLDDGYQAAIGDWLLRADSFPSSLDTLANDIARAGFQPGLWLAPFLAGPTSAVANEHPEWLMRRRSGRPAVGMWNPGWGGDVYVLDTTRPDVLAHLEELARTVVAMGWTYLKLDFTYAAALDGAWHDRSLSPAQRVRQAYDAIRRGAGNDAFILGCGAPLGPCIGVVDGMRIGPDVAPTWEPNGGWPGYEDTAPATANALRNTRARQFMHRRLWLNDPDCLMLRTANTALSERQVDIWAGAVAESGGMAIVSDDLALLGAQARARLDEVLTVGRSADDGYR